MRIKFLTTILFLLTRGLRYSKNALIDPSGDTVITISIEQMDRIYIELIEKDRMEEELEITLSKELKYIELIDSTQNDIKALKTQVNDLIDNNIALSRANNKNISRLTRSRKISLGLLVLVVIQVIL